MISLILLGCGSGSDELDFNGWYIPEQDTYLKVYDDGGVELLICTISNGYVADNSISGTLIGSELTINNSYGEFISNLVESQGEWSLISTETSYEAPIIKAFQLPVSCEGDVIEITSYSPEQAVAGVETEFILNFDFRLSTLNEAVIESGYTASSEGNFYLTNNELEVTSPGLSSGSLMVVASPELFENAEPFRLHVIMYSPLDAEDGSFIPIAGTDVVIDLSENNNNGSLNTDCLTCVAANPYP